MTKKFLKAIHRETGETIEFGLEDLVGSMFLDKGKVIPCVKIWRDEPPNINIEQWQFKDWLKDYDLFYFHQGEWFAYGK